MKQELEEYIRNCETCQKNKTTQNKTKMPLQITTTPDVVWEIMCIRHCGPVNTNIRRKQVLTDISG
jgi:hypothetical protein